MAVELLACTDAKNPRFEWSAKGFAVHKEHQWRLSPNFRAVIAVRVGQESSYTFQVAVSSQVSGKPERRNQASAVIRTNQPPWGGSFKVIAQKKAKLLQGQEGLFDILEKHPWRDDELPLRYR